MRLCQQLCNPMRVKVTSVAWLVQVYSLVSWTNSLRGVSSSLWDLSFQLEYIYYTSCLLLATDRFLEDGTNTFSLEKKFIFIVVNLLLFKSFQSVRIDVILSWYKLFKMLIRINLTKGVGIYFFSPSSPTFSPVLIIPNSQPSSWFLVFFQLLFWSHIRPHILSYHFCQPKAPHRHKRTLSSIQFNSITQSCLSLCGPMDCSTPGFHVLHQLPELTQTHVHQVSDAIQPSHPLLSLLFLPSIFPSIRIFSNESVLRIRWPKYWSFSFSIHPSSEYSGLISFRMDWFDLLAVQATLKSFLQHHSSKHQFLGAQLSLKFISHIHTWLLEKS